LHVKRNGAVYLEPNMVCELKQSSRNVVVEFSNNMRARLRNEVCFFAVFHRNLGKRVALKVFSRFTLLLSRGESIDSEFLIQISD